MIEWMGSLPPVVFKWRWHQQQKTSGAFFWGIAYRLSTARD